jgi:hypothetical protein
MASPVVGSMGVQFVDGWRQGVEQPRTTWKDGLWHGACQAGIGYFMGKGFEIGSTLVTRGAMHLVGRNHRLFQPVIWKKPTVRQQFDAARLQQEVDDAMSLVNRFREIQVRYVQAQTQYPVGSSQLTRMEHELSSMASSLNSSYHCKWVIKYKSGPLVRRAFKRLVDDSYARTMPGFRARLRAQGYNIDDLSFAPIRNHSSTGSTSMDLDLALQETVSVVRPDGTISTERVRITRHGEEVDMLTFQRDAQRAMNDAYNETTGFSAVLSEVNLTTSAHNEAFSDPALLAGDVDFSQVKELSTIGDVLEFKMRKIAGDPQVRGVAGDSVLSPIAKTQASCREASKEMENMLLEKLRQDIARTPPTSAEASQLQQDIAYWEGMLSKFKQIGRQETDPYRILELERQIRLDTGGKGPHEVIADLTRYFRQ